MCARAANDCRPSNNGVHAVLINDNPLSTIIASQQIYDTKCLHYIDWLVETRPSFSPPRRDLRPPGMDPGANEVYTERLDVLNTKFQRLLEQLTQRLKTAIEVSGADGLVSSKFFSFNLFIFKLINFGVRRWKGCSHFDFLRVLIAICTVNRWVSEKNELPWTISCCPCLVRPMKN